jgi:hypothetical protein
MFLPKGGRETPRSAFDYDRHIRSNLSRSVDSGAIPDGVRDLVCPETKGRVHPQQARDRRKAPDTSLTLIPN